MLHLRNLVCVIDASLRKLTTSSFIQYLVAVLLAYHVHAREMPAFAAHNTMHGYWTDTKRQVDSSKPGWVSTAVRPRHS